MTKPAGLAESPEPFDAQSSDKGTINLRIESKTRALIDEAAAMLGKTPKT